MVAGGIRIYIVPNMRRVLEDIREGTLDFVLLKPVNSQLLVSIREFVFWRITDLIYGGTAAAIGASMLAKDIGATQIATFVFMNLAFCLRIGSPMAARRPSERHPPSAGRRRRKV